MHPSAVSIVNLPTWLWIDAGMWHSYSVTASVGPVSATAVATPSEVTWSMGDGSVVLCDGPGTPYDPTVAPGQWTRCAHAYAVSSAGQPSPDGNANDGAFGVRATIDWSVSWSVTGAVGGGSLPGGFLHIDLDDHPGRAGGKRRFGRPDPVCCPSESEGMAGVTTLLDRGSTAAVAPPGSTSKLRLPTAPRTRRPLLALASVVVVFASVAGFAEL